MIYISDLDGTLLMPGARLSSFARENLRQLLEKGVKFTAASARSVASMRFILNGLPITLPIISSNGAYVSDMYSGKHYFIQDIPSERRSDLLDFFRSYGHVPFIACYDGKEDHVYWEKLVNGGMRGYYNELVSLGDKRLRNISRLENSLDEKYGCVFTMDRLDKILEMKSQIESTFPNHFQIYVYENEEEDWSWITVYDKRSSKGRAIAWMREEFLKEESLTVFGDQVNDISMFQEAEIGVCPNNAIEEIQTLATHIIAPHEEDSVIKYILEDTKKAAH